MVTRAGRRDRAGNVVALDLTVRQCLGEFVGAAIGIRRGGAAYRAGGEAAIDAIAVAAIGDDKKTLPSLRCRSSQDRGGDSHACHQEPHETPRAAATTAASIGLPEK